MALGRLRRNCSKLLHISSVASSTVIHGRSVQHENDGDGDADNDDDNSKDVSSFSTSVDVFVIVVTRCCCCVVVCCGTTKSCQKDVSLLLSLSPCFCNPITTTTTAISRTTSNKAKADTKAPTPINSCLLPHLEEDGAAAAARRRRRR